MLRDGSKIMPAAPLFSLSFWPPAAMSVYRILDTEIAASEAICMLPPAEVSRYCSALAAHKCRLSPQMLLIKAIKSITATNTRFLTVMQVCRWQAAAETSQRRGVARGQAWLQICPSHVGLLPFDKHRKYFLVRPLWGKATYSPPEKPSAVAEESSRSTWLLPAAAL